MAVSFISGGLPAEKPPPYYHMSLIIAHLFWFGLWFMLFNATFNNISVILWQSVLLVEETRVLVENHQPVTSH